MIDVLITGASGFVGKNLVANLECEKITVNKLKGRISEPILIASKVNAVIHLAGKAHDLRGSTSQDEYYKVNFGLTKQLYDAFLESTAKKFIFISSVKAAKDQIQGALFENTRPSPLTDYGKSKLMAEQYMQSRSLPAGKLCYILRPCMIHGSGNKGNLNLLYGFVSKGLPYPLASFSNQRSYLSVENLCFIIKEILERDDIPSGIYNVADDEPLSTNEVVTLLAEAQDRSPLLLKIPQSIIRLFAKVGDKLGLPLNTERLQKLTENFVVSNDKIKSVLKKELPLSAREGILKTARSFKNA